MLLERLSASTGDRHGSRIAILVLLAAAYQDNPALVEAALDEALRLGEPEGYLRTFVDAGDPLRQTLKSWLQHYPKAGDDPLRAYGQRVLLAYRKAIRDVHESQGDARSARAAQPARAGSVAVGGRGVDQPTDR